MDAKSHRTGDAAAIRLMRPAPRPDASARLLCLPYAGGSPSAYAAWARGLAGGIEVIAAQLPGRGGIADSGAPPALTETADCLLAAVGWALDRPLAVFGHSMGALLAFEFARTMRRRLGQAPLMLIVSAHDAPQHPRRTAALHKLPRPRFWEEIRNLDGTPEGVLDNADLRELAEPSLRRDLEAVETYRYVHERPLNCPIAAFVGRDDPNTSLEGVEAWSAQTDAGFALSVFPGGHFFQVSERTRVLSAVEHELRARVGLALPAIAEAGR